jgi:hypothetical protein
MDVFELEDGDYFKWQGEKYQFIRLDKGTDNAIVRREGSATEINFNPYAKIEKEESK